MLTREHSRAEGRLVGRGTFDQWLIEPARACGLLVHRRLGSRTVPLGLDHDELNSRFNPNSSITR